MNLDVNIIKNNINDYLQSMKNKDFYSLELLLAKLNNYCTGVKEELKYKVYELLNENGYSVDEIEENENAIAQELKLLQLQFDGEYTDNFQLKLKGLIHDFDKKLDKYVDKRNELKKPISTYSNHSNEYNRNIDQLNKIFVADCNLFIDNFSKLNKTEGLTISISDIVRLIKSVIKSDIRDIKKFKRDLKREFDSIYIKAEKTLNNKNKLSIIRNAENYLTDVVNIYENRIQMLSSKSTNSLVEETTKDINDDDEHIDNSKINYTESEDYTVVNDISNRAINNKKNEAKIDRYDAIRPLDINNKIIETESTPPKTEEQESYLINNEGEFKLNYSVEDRINDCNYNQSNSSDDIPELINRHNANSSIKNFENVENMNSISIENIINIIIKTSSNKIFELKEPLDENDKVIYDKIKQSVLFLVEKQNREEE